MNTSSEKRLSAVMPELARRVRAMITALAARGFTVEIVQGLRTFAEQDMLYAQGRTRKGPKVTNARGGQSNHNYGLAVDFAPVIGGKISWPEPHPVWQAIGEEARRVGLEWGGDWRKPDKPHVQLPGLSVERCQELYGKGKLALVWSEMEKLSTK